MKKYRNEWKYCCTEKELTILEGRLAAILQLDTHTSANGKYAVRSLYFDDYRDSCVQDNDAGLGKRHKYRIRYYGDNTEYMRLERKEKENGMCHKTSCRIDRTEYEALVNGEVDKIFWQTEEELLKKFCAEIMARKFEPKLVVDYERTAFVEPTLNVRITLDKNIAASNEVSRFLDHTYQKYPLQEKERHVLEVKFDHILPGYIRQIAYMDYLQQTSFSKYYLGRQKLQKIGRI